MASRLMLSLKKAAIEPAWSLTTMTGLDRGMTLEDGTGTIRFASRMLDGSQEILEETHALPNEGDIELEPMPRNGG